MYNMYTLNIVHRCIGALSRLLPPFSWQSRPDADLSLSLFFLGLIADFANSRKVATL